MLRPIWTKINTKLNQNGKQPNIIKIKIMILVLIMKISLQKIKLVIKLIRIT